MAKETDAKKAQETIISLFQQKNLKEERLKILGELVKTMLPNDEKEKEIEQLKTELKEAKNLVIKMQNLVNPKKEESPK